MYLRTDCFQFDFLNKDKKNYSLVDLHRSWLNLAKLALYYLISPNSIKNSVS